jgi:ABC-type polysaccharide transport system, permease component
MNSKRKDNLQLLLLALPAILLLFVFSYLPMGGIIIAFKKFRVDLGIFKSPWVGFKNFEFFFSSSDAWRSIRNTLVMNFLFIVVGTVFAVGFALLIFNIRSKRLVKTYQTVAIFPSFLSWVVVGYITYALLEPNGGLINQFLAVFGIDTVNWYSDASKWPAILLITNLWFATGNQSLFYFAALMGIEKDYFEAASLDGASKWQEIKYIILPFLTPLITIMTILAIGRIFRANFDMFFVIPRNVGGLYATTDVIDTYVYRSLIKIGDVGMSAAVGLFQSVVGFVLILATNIIVNKVEPENSLF